MTGADAYAPGEGAREPEPTVDHELQVTRDGSDHGTEAPMPEETGDILIDAALTDLADAPAGDLDAQIAAGEHLHRTLQARLADLGGD